MFDSTDPDRGRYKDLGIHHSLDIRHGAKSLAKKIAIVSFMYALKSVLTPISMY